MKIFDYAKEHPQEILAVTDEGEEILYGELNNLSLELGKIVGHRLVFVLCRNTPGSLLGYLGLLESGGVPLLLDADIAPALLEDLAKGDEFHGLLHTGDMARRDRDGYFYIVGRQSRFIKIAGKRIGLDEVEKILRTAFPELDLACAGKDEDLHVFAAATGENLTENGGKNGGENGRKNDGEDNGEKAFIDMKEKICTCIQDMTGISERRISVSPVSAIPRSSSGKIQYSVLNNL